MKAIYRIAVFIAILSMAVTGCSNGGGKSSPSAASSQPVRTGKGQAAIWIVYDTTIDQELLGVALPSYKIVERADCGSNPRAPVFGDGSVWVSNYGFATLTRIDPRQGKAVATIKPPYGVDGFAIGKAAAWVADDRNGVTRIDLASGQPVAEVPTDINPRRIAIADGAVWVTHGSFSVVRIDPGTNKKVATVVTKVDGLPVIPLDIAATKSAVWVATNRGAILRIDPSTNRVVATIKGLAGVSGVGVAMGGISRVIAGEGGVWAVSQKADSVARIDPASNRVVARIKVSPPIRDLAAGHGAVWVLHGQQGVLARIDPGSNQSADVAHFGRGAFALVVAKPAP